MSFWKQEPPKPTEACRNFGPTRLSVPATLRERVIRSNIGAVAFLLTNRFCDLTDVGSGGFANGAQRIDAGDPLGEKGVGSKLRQFGRPSIHRQHFGCT